MIKYWPDKGHDVTFGPLIIQCTGEDTVADVSIRTFKISNTKQQVFGSLYFIIIFYN